MSLNDFSNRWCKRKNIEPVLMPWRNGRLTFLKLMILVFHFTLVIHIFYPLNLSLLFKVLNDVSRIFIWTMYEAANSAVVVWRLYYINTIKRELVDTNANRLQPSLSKRVVVDGCGCRVPRLYWLPKLLKTYKARFIANSCFCTTIKLSQLLTSCLTAVINMLSNTVKMYMRDPVKIYFSLLKIQMKF